MRKILVLMTLLVLSAGVGAQPEMSRAAMQERVVQALSVFRQGGTWKARVEDHRDGFILGNFYIEYPNRAAFFLEILGQDPKSYYLGDQVKHYRGSSLFGESESAGSHVWFLLRGEIGGNVSVEMLAEETINYFGKSTDVVVSDLLHITAKGDHERLRVYVSKEGAPRYLGCAVLQTGQPTNAFRHIWFRDFHPTKVPADLFKPPVL